MNTKILTTHVGSLPRSKTLSEFLFAKDKGESFNLNEFDEVVSQNVHEIVKKQLDIGIDFISDGEMSKISYATYVKERINGFSGESERRAPADLDAFPEYKEKLDESLKNILLPSPDKTIVKKLFDYCCKHYPERFFDLLYKNDKIFPADCLFVKKLG